LNYLTRHAAESLRAFAVMDYDATNVRSRALLIAIKQLWTANNYQLDDTTAEVDTDDNGVSLFIQCREHECYRCATAGAGRYPSVALTVLA